MNEERILALDMSTKTGWASAVSGPDGISLEDCGTLPQIHQPDEPYPGSFVTWAYACYNAITELIDRFAPDVLVIEETAAGSKAIYTQKILEFLHFLIAKFIKDTGIKAVYLMTGEWRREIGCQLTKEERKHNKEVREYKKKYSTKVAYDKNKKRIGLINRKHVNIRVANEAFGKYLKEPLRKKDEDKADALGLLLCYHNRRKKSL